MKLNAFQDYPKNYLSFKEVCRKYSITSKNSLVNWIKKYNDLADFKSTNRRKKPWPREDNYHSKKRLNMRKME